MVEDNEERQVAEVEFVQAAYEHDEAWCSRDDLRTIHRRLKSELAAWHLRLTMSKKYPGEDQIAVDVQVDQSCRKSARKGAFTVLPDLFRVCQDAAGSCPGEEAVLLVFSAAEEWLESEALKHLETVGKLVSSDSYEGSNGSQIGYRQCMLSRRLIYSHHIISEKKRADVLDLAKHFQLGGFMKIGWPGLILIEGKEVNCNEFYDTIRRWPWQYLVVRGEMQHSCSSEHILENSRLFPSSFKEVEDMSVVADHCRKVGLEVLFRTSMKIYETDGGNKYGEVSSPYGALVLVDHMNDGKSYRKWLRKVSYEHDAMLFIQQVYPNDDYSKKPKILVGLVGNRVQAVLKHWRTRKVDIDSRGRPCLERMMTVLVEGELSMPVETRIDWHSVGQDDKSLNSTGPRLRELVNAVGGRTWVESTNGLFNCRT